MYFALVRTLSIESGNSNLLKKTNVFEISANHGKNKYSHTSKINGTRDKMPPDPHSSLLLH